MIVLLMMNNLRVRLLLASHLAYDIRQRHYVILGQREGLDFAELPLHLHVRYHLSQLLSNKTVRISIFVYL